MRMKLFAGMFVFASIIVVPHWTDTVRAAERGATRAEHGTKINISRIKHALKLTAVQKRYWPPVAAVLIRMSHRPAHQIGVTSIARFAAVARPLVRLLDDEQKQTAMMLAQEMGFGWVLARLN